MPFSVAPEEALSEIPKNITRDPSKTYLAQPEAVEALIRLCSTASRDGVGIVVISSHRTHDFQKNYFEDAERRHGRGRGKLWVAPAGFSEHHTGYVFDLADKNHPATDDEPAFESTPASAWLKINAGNFGFELSFPPKNWQGVSYEPWHWRFTGSPEARTVFHPPMIEKTSAVIKSMMKAFGLLCALAVLLARPAFAELVTFKTSDGITLEGDFIKPAPGKVTLILLHGYLSNRPEWEAFAGYCKTRGIGALYFDLRGHGKSQGGTQDFSKMSDDLARAADFLVTQHKIPRQRIGVGGASIGANIAFRAFAADKKLALAILLSPGLNYQGLSTEDLAGSIAERPVLLAASSGDRYAFHTVGVLERAAKSRANLAVIRQKSSPAHGVQMFQRASPQAPSELEKRIVGWIEKHAK